jgi:hypothetical protein
MKQKLTILLLLFLVYICAFGQEDFIEPQSKPLTTVKFKQFVGGVVIFKALFDNFKDSLNFILDTGSGGISLDSTTAVSLGLTPSPPERLIRGIAGTRKVGFLKNRMLRINDLIVDSLDFHVIDYEMLSSLYGERVDGIIGYSLLKRYIVHIDYDDMKITFCSSGTMKYPRGGYLLYPRINTLPILSSRVTDARVSNFSFLFDIGAGLTALFSDDYIQDSALLKPKRIKYLKQGEGLGGKVDIYLTIIKELKIGPYKFKKVPINIFNDKYNVTSYPVLGGLVGNDIFRRFNCILNYNKKQIHITPNTHFRDPFDYAYSGIELYLIGGKIITSDIPPGSPAEKAGFKAGDEVLAVNNHFGMNLSDLKQELQSSIGTVKVVIRRNGELQMVTMRTIDIMKNR